MPKSHSLNLFDLQTETDKFEIDVTSVSVDVNISGEQSLVIHPPLKLIDATNGNIDSVSSKLHSIDTAIAAETASRTEATASVQTNLDSYITSNNSAVSTLNNTVVTNKAISDANHTSDAASRVDLRNDMEALITAEETRAVSAEGVLTSSLATEVNNRTNAVTVESSARAAADTDLQTKIDIEKGRIDGILAGTEADLDTFLEVINNYQSLNTDALDQITALNTALSALTARMDELTSSGGDP